MRVSPAIEDKTRKYLRSHGCEPGVLTQNQWEMVMTQVKHIRHTWICLLIIIACALFTGWLCLNRFAAMQHSIESLASEDIIFYTVVAEDFENMIEPQAMRNKVDGLCQQFLNIGIFFTIPIVMMVSAVISIMHAHERRKVIEAFLPGHPTLEQQERDKKI